MIIEIGKFEHLQIFSITLSKSYMYPAVKINATE